MTDFCDNVVYVHAFHQRKMRIVRLEHTAALTALLIRDTESALLFFKEAHEHLFISPF